jgi:hypothetical protein
MRLIRLGWWFGVLALAASGHAQVWEKLMLPGLTYRMEVDSGTPRVIHALRFSPGSPVAAKPALARGSVFTVDPARSRATVSEIVMDEGAIAGINADFFPFTGDPLGLMVRDGELLSAPFQNRSVFAWGDDYARIAKATFRASVSGSGTAIGLDGFNEECSGNKAILNSERAGLARMRAGGVAAIVRVTRGALQPSGRLEAEVVRLATELAIPVAPGTAVLAATGSRANVVSSLRPGQTLTIEWETGGFDWNRARHAVGGGPNLVTNGAISLDWSYQAFNEPFAMTRHPRTAVGFTREGDVWFLAIDGRQSVSAGATLEETARIMIRLGCVDAMNLDGGGSTALNLWGTTLNRPSDGTERAVANGIVFLSLIQSNMGSNGDGAPAGYRIRAPQKLEMGQEATLDLIGPDGLPARGVEVVWSATGSAWIDQSGLLRPLSEGECKVKAWWRGSTFEAVVPIVAKP